ncbi:hypothetical protein AV540_16505 [Brevibacillus parabrevis]|uniref:hypothetical protein n=1 Tax=Brevibacillus parabrevis TaxID=54914 RepID=UPI0007ABEED3|nr:hypothetical protein [Brevibacillus parabrevis]KZE48859.1 hypothetical protein AV540_16505 [Brevibacillus parabrevis]
MPKRQLRAGSFIPEHDTDADVLLLVQKGKAVFDFSGEQIELDPQALLYMLPAEYRLTGRYRLFAWTRKNCQNEKPMLS